MTRIIVTTSGKGGVGKTTITANLGMAIAKMGQQVVLVDADFNLKNLDLLLGLEKRVVYGVFDILAGECRLEQALVKDKRQPNLALLPVSQKRTTRESVTPEQIKPLLQDLSQKYQYVLIDSPAGIDMGFESAIAPASEALIVTTPEIPSVRDADRVIKLLDAQGVKSIYLIINRVRPEIVKFFNTLSIQDVQELLAIPLIGVIPEDENVIVATNRGEPLVLTNNTSGAAVAFHNIARRLKGETVAFLDFDLSDEKILNTNSTVDPVADFMNLHLYL